MSETDEPTAITRRLEELRLEHRDLDAAIDRLVSLGNLEAHDDLALKRLKKRKLWLKDCIARLQSALIPDEPA
ncbi:YdcH family protein [Novilysobacter erysipheiresistens]|uniref:YdcH family protein n=1 Tax=Novilysobacter erysipheiresistens TaxID=1749332 RepID=A0ABU7YYD8_9GAMM